MLIRRHNHLLGIDKICQKAVVEVYIPVCQVSNLETLQQIRYFFRAGQNRWYHNQRSQLFWNA